MKELVFILFFMFSIINIDAQAIYSRFSVRCLGVELDGTQTLRVQGYGRNRQDAKEQAKKNAVWAVIFDGVRDGVEGCNIRPIIAEANAKERYEDYFNNFFKDGGSYNEFVSLKDTKKGSGVKSKDKLGYAYDLTVRVLRIQLKAHLEKDNIIKEK